MEIRLKEIVDLLNGDIKNIENIDLIINNISTDTRKIKGDSLFIPLKGENFDGHSFIDSAFDKGAVVTISEEYVNHPSIIVEDSKKAYLKIAEFYREKVNPKVIAITGSVGKTTTKEIIYRVLKKDYKVLTTYKNHNNEIGVAQTVLNLEQNHDILVIELGIDHPGEMDILSKIVKPNYVVLTNIGDSHLGNFKSSEEILSSKLEILNYISEDGIIIYNGDDNLLEKTINDYKYKTFSFGYNTINQIITKKFKSEGILGNEINVESNGKSYEIKTKAIGNHLGYSILPAIKLGEIFNLSSNNIIQGIEEYESTEKRMALVDLGDIKIINDTYNASLKSIKSALNTLEATEYSGNKIAFLGDILELGDMSKGIHEKLGEFSTKKNIDKIVFVGNNMKYAYEKAIEKEENKNKFLFYPSKGNLKLYINKIVYEKSIVLLKGSRGTKMEDIIEFLRSRSLEL